MPGTKLWIVVLIITLFTAVASGWAETAKKEQVWTHIQSFTYSGNVKAKDIRTEQLIPPFASGNLTLSIVFVKTSQQGGVNKAKFGLSSTVMCSTSSGTLEAKGPSSTLTTKGGLARKMINYDPRDYFPQNNINPKKCYLMATVKGKNTKKGQVFNLQWDWAGGF